GANCYRQNTHPFVPHSSSGHGWPWLFYIEIYSHRDEHAWWMLDSGALCIDAIYWVTALGILFFLCQWCSHIRSAYRAFLSLNRTTHIPFAVNIGILIWYRLFLNTVNPPKAGESYSLSLVFYVASSVVNLVVVGATCEWLMRRKKVDRFDRQEN